MTYTGYSPPKRDVLRTAVFRDLRDPGEHVFSATEVNDFLDFGVAALNPVWPKETVIAKKAEADIVFWSLEGRLGIWRHVGAKLDLHIDAIEVWRVDVKPVGQQYPLLIPHVDEQSDLQSGWAFYDGYLYWYGPWVKRLNDWTTAGADVIIHGYSERLVVTDDSTDYDFSAQAEEFAVREYARLAGLRRLNVDRSLFQQWQTQANNTDVSPNQLAGMLAQAEDSWRRWTNRNFRPRRRPVG